MGIKQILSKFDQLKHDYFDRRIVQLTLDYFLALEGSTINFKSPPTASNLQYRESPVLRPNCCMSHAGTVVRKDVELVEAKDNTVFVPSGNKSPNRDMDSIVFKITYPIGKKLIYPDTYMGNGDMQNRGMRCINMTIQNPRQLRGLAILSSGIEAIKRVSEKHYQVRSQHGDFYYDVQKKYGIGWMCSCPNWQEYQKDCKHIYAVHFSQQLRLEIERDIDTDSFKYLRLLNALNVNLRMLLRGAREKQRKDLHRDMDVRIAIIDLWLIENYQGSKPLQK